MTVTAPAEMVRRLRALADAASRGPLCPED